MFAMSSLSIGALSLPRRHRVVNSGGEIDRAGFSRNSCVGRFAQACCALHKLKSTKSLRTSAGCGVTQAPLRGFTTAALRRHTHVLSYNKQGDVGVLMKPANHRAQEMLAQVSSQ